MIRRSHSAVQYIGSPALRCKQANKACHINEPDRRYYECNISPRQGSLCKFLHRELDYSTRVVDWRALLDVAARVPQAVVGASWVTVSYPAVDTSAKHNCSAHLRRDSQSLWQHAPVKLSDQS